MVDIDPNELRKVNVHPHLSICCDAAEFMKSLAALHSGPGDYGEWWAYCRTIMDRYPVMMPEYNSPGPYVNSYVFVRALSEAMRGDDIYVCSSSGSALDVSMTVFKIKKGQRVFSTKGLASMGFDIPASIGACLASGKKRTICVTGDGSFQMNVQELETLARLNLPVKIFVLDNGGYALIRNSHMGAFNGRLTACTPESGLTLPDVLKQARVYGIKSVLIDEKFDLGGLSELLEGPGPLIGKVKVDIAQKLIPRQASYRNSQGQMESLPLEEMIPRLSDEEMEEIMLIPRFKPE
jgi:acetolactate synthase-1/2/3 large subunit